MVAPCDWEVDPSVCWPEWATVDPAIQARAITLATRQMWAATGRQYGPCEWTIQPCAPGRRPPLYQVYPEPFGRGSWGGGAGYYPYIIDGQWFNPGWGGCGCCSTGCEVLLQGPTRTVAIQEVTVAGVVVPPEAYVVQNAEILVRIDGNCWPSCVNFGHQDPPDFEIRYLRGLPVPAAVLIAAGELAAEFAKACINLPCRLPQRLRRLTRQGVELMVDQVDRNSSKFLTGIEEIDMVIQSENPNGLQARPRIYSPDRRKARRPT